jgi:hypothetical protein
MLVKNNLKMLHLYRAQFKAVLRSRIIFVRLMLRVQILMHLRLILK